MIEIILGLACCGLGVAVIYLAWGLRYAMHRIESLDRTAEALGNMTSVTDDRVNGCRRDIAFIAQNLAPMAEAIERKADAPVLHKNSAKRNPNRPAGL